MKTSVVSTLFGRLSSARSSLPFVFSLVCLALSGCVGGGGGGCIPNQPFACTCADGASGSAQCGVDGIPSMCVCGPGAPTPDGGMGGGGVQPMGGGDGMQPMGGGAGGGEPGGEPGGGPGGGEPGGGPGGGEPGGGPGGGEPGGGPGGGGGPDCDACGTVAECFGSDACPNPPREVVEQFGTLCDAQCEVIDEFIGGLRTCDAIFGAVIELAPSIADACDGGDPPPPPVSCDDACDRFRDCLLEPDYCPGFANGGPDLADAVRGICADACSQNSEFGRTVLDYDTCADIYEAYASGDDDFSLVCRDEPNPEPSECVGFGERIASCATEACADLGVVEEGIARQFVRGCAAQVAEGTPAEPFGGINRNTPCDDPNVVQVVSSEVNGRPDGSDGAFQDFCSTSMPALDLGVCEDACDRVLSCASRRTILGDPPACVSLCYVSQGLASLFECAEAARTCQAAIDCFSE